MSNKLTEMQNELSYLSDKIFLAQQEKKKLMQRGEECHFLFQKNDRFLQGLKYEWETGEMNFFMHNVERELKHHQQNTIQEIEDRIYLVNDKVKLLEEQQQDLQRKIRMFASSDDNKD